MPTINLSPFTAEQAAIERRRKMAEALQQQAQQPMELPTTPGVQLSPLGGLAKVFQSYMGARAEQQALADQKKYEADTMSDMAKIYRNINKYETIPGTLAVPEQTTDVVEPNIANQNLAAVALRQADQKARNPNAPISPFERQIGEDERAQISQLPLESTQTRVTPAVEAVPERKVPLLSFDSFNDPNFMKGSAGRMMLAQALIQRQAQEQAKAEKALEIKSRNPEEELYRTVDGKVEIVSPAKSKAISPKWEKFSKYDTNGQEIIGLIDKNAADPFATFIQGAKKPEDLVSVDTTNEQGQAVTRYFNKSDPLLKSGVPKPFVGILGDLQAAGVLPTNWKENPAIVDLVNTSFINKAGGITSKNVFDFKLALADLNIKRASLADQGINANVAIPAAPAASSGVLNPIQNANQPAVSLPVVNTNQKGNAKYTPLNAVSPAQAASAPPPTEIPPASGLSPRDMREIEKQKLLSANKDMTETQSNSALFGGSMAQANATMMDLEKSGTVKNAVIPAMMQSLVGLVPLGVGEKVADQIETIARLDPTSLVGSDQNQQRLAQAQLAFAMAWLRKTSGAAFGASEVSNTIKEFFPMIGEGDKVIKQKREARERAIDGMRLGTTKEGQAYIDKYMGGQPKTSLGSGADPLGLRGGK
jgi:hypothetical protein